MREIRWNIHIILVAAFIYHTGYFFPFISLHLRLFNAYHTWVFLTFYLYHTCTSCAIHISHLTPKFIVSIHLFHLRGKYPSFVTPALFWVLKYFTLWYTPLLYHTCHLYHFTCLLAESPNCSFVWLLRYRTMSHCLQFDLKTVGIPDVFVRWSKQHLLCQISTVL